MLFFGTINKCTIVDNNHCTIGVFGTIVVIFRNKKSPVQELIDLYCSQEDIDPLDLNILFQGKELQCSTRPAQDGVLENLPGEGAGVFAFLTQSLRCSNC